MKVMVTGGCGFIGSNLSSILKRNGINVTIVDNLSRGRIKYLDNPQLFNIHEVDIRDEEGICDIASGHDAIIHLAAYGSVVDSVLSPEENFSVNAEGTFKILSAARKNGIKKIIFSSTGGALIGNATPPVSEESVPRPISPYGASKLAGEGYCCAFANAYDMSVTALRFANVIGPISWHKKGAVTAFFKAIMNNTPIIIYGDGNATRDFLYVDDLCQGINSALNFKKEGFHVFHLASGREISIRELAEIAVRVANVPEHPIHFQPKRKGEVERNCARYDLANDLLGFKPKVDIEEAMSITWKWFQNYKKLQMN